MRYPAAPSLGFFLLLGYRFSVFGLDSVEGGEDMSDLLLSFLFLSLLSRL